MTGNADFGWNTLSSELAYDCRVFRLDKHTRANSRKKGEFYVLSGNDWVNIIPLTENNEVVMVEQFRHGTQNVTLEIPGGLIDDGETPLAAARREMNEETGYDGEDIIPLGTISPNPAIQSNHCHSFLVRNVRNAMEIRPDEFEEIRVKLVPLADIPGLIANGAISHALVVVAFSYFMLQHPGVFNSQRM